LFASASCHRIYLQIVGHESAQQVDEIFYHHCPAWCYAPYRIPELRVGVSGFIVGRYTVQAEIVIKVPDLDAKTCAAILQRLGYSSKMKLVGFGDGYSIVWANGYQA
jgi:hypothetical protein